MPHPHTERCEHNMSTLTTEYLADLRELSNTPTIGIGGKALRDILDHISSRDAEMAALRAPVSDVDPQMAYELFEDGPGRWVLTECYDEDHAPVFGSIQAAFDWCQRDEMKFTIKVHGPVPYLNRASRDRTPTAESTRIKPTCDDCGGPVSSYPQGCPTCAAPQCCKACCISAPESTGDVETQ